MITIFRRVREKLIVSGSVAKYLLYAIGEILLVVLGILIALQINNWNEDAKTRGSINGALMEVVQDLESDVKVLSDEIVKRENDLQAQLRVIRFLESDTQRYDSLYTDLGHVLLKRNTPLLSNGYDLLNDIGISQLKDATLRERLVIYYEVIHEEVENEIEDDEFEFEENWLPYVRNHFREWEFGEFAYPNDDDYVFNDSYFLTSLKINLNNIRGTLESHRIALNQSVNLIKLINERQI